MYWTDSSLKGEKTVAGSQTQAHVLVGIQADSVRCHQSVKRPLVLYEKQHCPQT